MIDIYFQLEEKAKQLAPLQKTLIDLQYKLHSYRETWLRERSELQRQLDEAQRAQLEEKQNYVDLLSEVSNLARKLQLGILLWSINIMKCDIVFHIINFLAVAFRPKKLKRQNQHPP